MADLSKLKQRRPSTLGAPPGLDEASSNLEAPEVAPPLERVLPTPAPAPKATPIARAGEGAPVRDGRSRRRTGRTLQFATRVSPEFDAQLRRIADAEDRLLVEILERALDLYETTKRKQ